MAYKRKNTRPLRAVEESELTQENTSLKADNESLRAQLQKIRRSNTMRELEVEHLFQQKVALANALRYAEAKMAFLEGREANEGGRAYRGWRFWLPHPAGAKA